jgi:hypothetical protein
MVNVRDGNAQGVLPPTEGEIERGIRDLAIVRVAVAGDKWPGFYFEQMGLPTQPPEFFFRRGLVVPEAGPVLDQFCNIVRMDKPVELLSHILDWLKEQGVPLKKKFQVEQGSEFLMYHTDMMECYGRLLRVVMRRVGGLKYQFGMMRPEEIWNRSFAAYECPNHPEFPAWHGSFAGILMAVIEYFFDLTQEFKTKREDAPKQNVQEALEDILRVFSHCRDLAGMHFQFSSHVGFNVAKWWAADLLADGAHSLDPFAPITAKAP